MTGWLDGAWRGGALRGAVNGDEMGARVQCDFVYICFRSVQGICGARAGGRAEADVLSLGRVMAIKANGEWD